MQVLSGDSLVGGTLDVLIGYEPSQSGMQLLFYVVTLALILFFCVTRQAPALHT